MMLRMLLVLVAVVGLSVSGCKKEEPTAPISEAVEQVQEDADTAAEEAAPAAEDAAAEAKKAAEDAGI